MSRSRKGRGRTPRSRRKDSSDELEELEPLEGLEEAELEELEEFEELEELDDAASPVEVTIATATDGQHEVELKIDTGELEKSAVADAVGAPLRSKIAEDGDALRWKRILVTFGGNAMISSAARDAVGEAMRQAKPSKVTIVRGYGDEVVHEAEPPSVQVDASEWGEPATTKVRVLTGELDADDLAYALDGELRNLCAGASGKRFALEFVGVQPNAKMKANIRDALAGAGAVRVAALSVTGSERVLFDKELADRVSIREVVGGAAEVHIDVTPSEDEAKTVESLEFVVPNSDLKLSGKRVATRFVTRKPGNTELSALRALARTGELGELHVAGPEDDPYQLWPPLIQVAKTGDGTTLRMPTQTQGRAATIALLQRELPTLDNMRGQNVTIDWPEASTIDAELERVCVTEGLVPLGPARVDYTFGGDAREPVYPTPLRFEDRSEGTTSVCVCELHTEAARPGELQRAIERRMAEAAPRAQGRSFEVVAVGQGVVTRTLRGALKQALRDAGIKDARLKEGGSTEILLPELLTLEEGGTGEVRITVDAGSRTEAELAAALTQELDSEGLAAGANVHLMSSANDDVVVKTLVDRGVNRVILEGEKTVCVHPPLFSLRCDETSVVIRAAPRLEDDEVMAQVEHELSSILEEAGDLGKKRTLLVWPAVSRDSDPLKRTIEALVALKPESLFLDQDNARRARQLLPEIHKDWVTELGRGDKATPPILLLGIDWTDDPEDMAHVGEKLAALTDDIEGRRVLIVFKDNDSDRTVRSDDPLLAAVRAFLESHCSALLRYAEDREVGGHFVVIYSKIEPLRVGMRAHDPRGRSAATAATPEPTPDAEPEETLEPLAEATESEGSLLEDLEPPELEELDDLTDETKS